MKLYKTYLTLCLIMFITNTLFAQKIISFKNKDNKDAKVTIPGKLAGTIRYKDGTIIENYVSIDEKNKQVIFSDVTYMPTYIGHTIYVCKFNNIDKELLAKKGLLEQKENYDKSKYYPYILYSLYIVSEEKAFKMKFYSPTAEGEPEESDVEKGFVIINFSDEKTGKEFIEKLKKSVGN